MCRVRPDGGVATSVLSSTRRMLVTDLRKCDAVQQSLQQTQGYLSSHLRVSHSTVVLLTLCTGIEN